MLATIRKLFNWACERGMIETSPCAGVKPPTPERARDRVLADAELCADLAGGRHARLSLRGVRQAPDLDRPAARRGRRHEAGANSIRMPDCGRCRESAARTASRTTIPLSEPAVSDPRGLPRIGDTLRAHDHRQDGDQRLFRRQEARSTRDSLPNDMPPIRRGCTIFGAPRRRGMARLGINLPVIEKVLNHSSGSFGGVVGVYQRHNFSDEKRHALERWGAHVADLVSDRRSQNVVRLETRA